PGLADQRRGQSLAVMNVVEAEAPLDAKALAIGDAVASFDAHDTIVGDVIGELAANTAIRTHRRDGLVHRDQIGVVRRRERTGGAGLHAFAARDAGGYTHRIGKIEYDLRARAAKRVADDVVDLFFAAGAYASRALDAGVEIDCHRRMREVGRRLRAGLEARHADLQPSLPVIELRIELVNPLRHVRGQHFDHQLLRVHRARAVARDFHSSRRCAAARRRKHALTLDLDHARAAIAVGAHAFLVAKMRDIDTVTLGRLDNRLAALGAEPDTVE